MNYDLPVRYLARADYGSPPGLVTAQLLTSIPEALGLSEIQARPVTQLSIASGTLQQTTALVGSGWQLTSGIEGVAVEFQPSVPGAAKLSFGEFVERAGKALAVVADTAVVAAHRLALVQEGMLSEMSDADKDQIAHRLLSFPGTFSPPWEWDWRCVQTVVRAFGGLSEPTNTIAIVKRLSGQLPSGEFDRIRVDLDINTKPKHSNPRFSRQHVEAFFGGAGAWFAELSKEMRALLEGA